MSFINSMCRRLVDSIPMFLMVLGSAGLLGWVIHSPWLVRFNGEASSWPPMSQWAALGFFLLGWSHLGDRTWKYSKWVAGFLLVLGLAFLFENMFNVSFACLDYAWANYWSDFWIENPGRLALGTSVCFLLSSLHMLSREKPVQDMLGSAISAIAALHLINFSMDPMRHSVNLMSHMSTPAAIGFCFWGLYCIFRSSDGK